MEENNISTGINIDEDSKRYYPYGSVAAQIIGFCGSDNQGLDGIEALYSTYQPGDERYIRRLAEEYDLKLSGGSDFHGSNKPHIQLGSGMGHLFVPYELLEALRP